MLATFIFVLNKSTFKASYDLWHMHVLSMLIILLFLY